MYFGAMRGMPAERLKEVAAFWRTLDTAFTNTDAPEDEPAESETPESREQDNTPDEPPTKGTRKVKDYLHEGLTKPAWFLP